MNLVVLKGNVVRDPQLRKIDGGGGKGTSVVNFTVAVSREYTKADGTSDKITTFVSCEAWDSGAENIASSFKKGDLVMLEGSLRNDSWEKDGVKHSTMKIRVSTFAKIFKNRKDRQQTPETEEAMAF
jgi:single-strand DNA-binding protein